MWSNILLLFALSSISGMLAIFIGDLLKVHHSKMLVFSGGYLFAVTVLHLLPDVFVSSADVTFLSISVVAGFFFQHILENFTQGIEHGHMHKISHAHDHTSHSVIGIMIALSMHAFLEGGILISPESPSDHGTKALFTGIVLHKIPATFALISVLLCYVKKRSIIYLSLILFSLSTPLGILTGNYFFIELNDGVHYFVAFVGGGFLHISTTIVFESNKNHLFNFKKLLWGILGSLFALLLQVFFFNH
ncbi:MAG: ZIP family metal transporter [Cyclobacteriaceae bacterium]|nr:ZIP family metal transporter [Cyclobacteriaceae bacterium]